MKKKTYEKQTEVRKLRNELVKTKARYAYY